jgi:putative transposase
MPQFEFRVPDAIEVLERVRSEVGYPGLIRVDQGSDFISRDLDLWVYTRNVTLDFSRPGKTTDNALSESLGSPAFGSTASSRRSA